MLFKRSFVHLYSQMKTSYEAFVAVCKDIIDVPFLMAIKCQHGVREVYF